jgi:hypothetical protein
MPPTVSDEEKCAHQLLALTVELRHPQHLAITPAHGLDILSLCSRQKLVRGGLVHGRCTATAGFRTSTVSTVDARATSVALGTARNPEHPENASPGSPDHLLHKPRVTEFHDISESRPIHTERDAGDFVASVGAGRKPDLFARALEPERL